MRELAIAGRRVADNEPPFVVAEIGHNHQGSVDTCKLLFRAAADCGASAVKLQKRDNRALYAPQFYASPYHSENAYADTYGEHREALEFGWDEYVELKAYAEALGLIFFATAFDIPSADFLARLDVPAFKIASGDLDNLPLLRHVARLGRPVIVSTGGGDMEAVTRAAGIFGGTKWNPADPYNPYPLAWHGVSGVAFLQCTAAYPCEPAEMNLRVIETYRREFPDTVIGLSDHQSGIALGPVAFALGARIFEKHFTLQRSWKGSDHAFSLEPVGLRKYVRDLRRTAEALGDGIKRRYPSEEAPLYKMRKSPFVERAKPGEPPMLGLRSPADGVEAWKIDKLRGRRAQVETGQFVTSTGVFE